MLAHLPTWQRLPDNLKAVIARNVTRYVRLQREDQRRANARLRAELAAGGLMFNDVAAAPFRRRLSRFYAAWKGPAQNEVLVAARSRLRIIARVIATTVQLPRVVGYSRAREDRVSETSLLLSNE